MVQNGARVRRGRLSKAQWDDLLKTLPPDLSQGPQNLSSEPQGPKIIYEEGLATLAFRFEDKTVVLQVHPYHLYHGRLRQFFLALDRIIQSLAPVEPGEKGLLLIPFLYKTSPKSPPSELSEILLEASRTPWNWYPLPSGVDDRLNSKSIYSVDGRNYRLQIQTTIPSPTFSTNIDLKQTKF